MRLCGSERRIGQRRHENLWAAAAAAAGGREGGGGGGQETARSETKPSVRRPLGGGDGARSQGLDGEGFRGGGRK